MWEKLKNASFDGLPNNKNSFKNMCSNWWPTKYSSEHSDINDNTKISTAPEESKIN